MAKFCVKCGSVMEDHAVFCQSCGTQANAQPQQAPYQPPMPPYQQPVVYVKPKIPGRGLGIASMVLGIIGLVYSFVFLINIIQIFNFSNQISEVLVRGFGPAFIVYILLFSSMSIMAVCFGITAKNKGYTTGVSKSGLVLGAIGACVYAISIVMFVASMA